MLTQNQIPTAPTGVDLKEEYVIPHSIPPLRLDYFFVSKDLKSKVKGYEVITRNPIPTLSDHFPILLELE